MAKVYSNSVEGRVHFEGPDDDARQYVENNFPRTHVEPGSGIEDPQPDVYLQTDKGGKEQLVGGEWEAVKHGSPSSTPSGKV